MGRIGELVLFFAITAIASFMLRMLFLTGHFKFVVNHSPGPCKLIKVNGSEDLALLPDGLVFVSSEMRFQLTLTFNKELEGRKGKLLTFDLNKPDEAPVELPMKNFNRTGFNPHGISVYRDPSTGAVALFVVSHRPDAQVIEIFDFDRQGHSLIHRRSVMDELIWSPNNLHALGPDSFYMTNDNFFNGGNKLLALLQAYFLHDVLRGNVVYFDGKKAFEVAKGVNANGITMDKDERFVFVTTSFDRSLRIYRRLEDNMLDLSQEIYVDAFADNINVDPLTGNLWLAGIPRPVDAAERGANLTHPCPSQVFVVKLGKPSSTSGIAFPEYELRVAYANDGDELSLATTALVYKDLLLAGTIDGNMLLCKLIYY
ncbi:serum paraoxonase/lactonase 3-like isoform X1 [Montipora foliosa]|uniref:serum paraoxonase/lactonase 3-like isoform X1 n=2 Tax=Montipora foliosa TaxID=591990 RepID=UPI0035F10D32